MDENSPPGGNLRRAHPLADELIRRLRPGAAVLELGAGSGRNTASLRAAGMDVCAIADGELAAFQVESAFDGALSTHGLLHGTPALVRALLERTARALKPGAPFYCTFASKRDARFGVGTRVDDDTFAPDSGDEAGVAHVYFDEAGLRALAAPSFVIESLSERRVDDIVGSWAHAQRPRGSLHWFFRARRADQ